MSRARKNVLVTSLLLASFGSAIARGAETGSLEDAWRWITSEDLRASVSYLASDRLGGRGTGEPGIALAEHYIAASFEEAGLVPVPGHDEFALTFSLYARAFDADRSRLRFVPPASEPVDSVSIDPGVIDARAGEDFRPFAFSDQGELDAEIVFAGYGITAPDLDYDDYAGLDVEGKVVLVLRHEPRETDPASVFDGAVPSPHAFFLRKAENAEAHGARGMLLVTDPLHHRGPEDLRWTTPLYLDREEADALGLAEAAPDSGTPFLAAQISGSLARQLLETAGGRPLDEIQRSIDESMEPEPVDLHHLRVRMRIARDDSVQTMAAHDIAGFLPGSDPDVADEWIVIGAHHDHLGRFAGTGDTIYNGADDNASGTAAVLALAEAFGRSPSRPRRSLVFVTFTAEERGLLGSYALVRQNLIDMDRVSFLLNIDMIGRNPDRPLS
ncbi:MAG: M28 family peptidase [Candidatus Eisenbacteria bacterium]